jgi:hypothetical protein
VEQFLCTFTQLKFIVLNDKMIHEVKQIKLIAMFFGTSNTRRHLGLAFVILRQILTPNPNLFSHTFFYISFI